MALLLDNNDNASRWFDVDAVPEAYTFPQEFRPGNFETENNKQNSFPVIDLSKLDHSSEEKEETIKKILKSCQEFGGFQVQPVEENWVYLSSTDYANDGVHLWRENIKLILSHPLEDCMQRWLEKPSRYSRYKNTGIDMPRTGLESTTKRRGTVRLLSANNYPPCPDPRNIKWASVTKDENGLPPRHFQMPRGQHGNHNRRYALKLIIILQILSKENSKLIVEMVL
ncbi:hypothetical protein Leryth_020980 [Lithospermum erythrorhizon]|nr:hypothetical protein Leryth_020980 [Lithospermum erythrorhizon]